MSEGKLSFICDVLRLFSGRNGSFVNLYAYRGLYRTLWNNHNGVFQQKMVRSVVIDLWRGSKHVSSLCASMQPYNGKPSLLNRILGVLCVFTCLACLRAYVLGVLPCLACLSCSRVWRACVLGFLACFWVHVLCVLACLLWWNVLHSYVFAFLACLALAYSRFYVIIYFVCINQGFAIKGKLLIHVNLS